MIFGPEVVGDAGFTANVEAPTGMIHVDLACKDQVETLAAAYVAGQALPAIKTLATQDISGKGSLRVARAHCEVALIARQLATTGGALSFDWRRPPAEIARATGGPIIACARPAK